MYLYYALAAMGPGVAKYLWWKRYLTMIQLVSAISLYEVNGTQTTSLLKQIQFTLAMIASGVTLYYDCDFPLWMHYLLIVYMVTFLALFGNFYMKAYLKKGNHRQAVSSAHHETAHPAKTVDFILSHEGKKLK